MCILPPDSKRVELWQINLSIYESLFGQKPSQEVTIFLQLELKYAAETNALQPPHKYVPWVVVDGEPLYEVSSAIYIACIVMNNTYTNGCPFF